MLGRRCQRYWQILAKAEARSTIFHDVSQMANWSMLRKGPACMGGSHDVTSTIGTWQLVSQSTKVSKRINSHWIEKIPYFSLARMFEVDLRRDSLMYLFKGLDQRTNGNGVVSQVIKQKILQSEGSQLATILEPINMYNKKHKNNFKRDPNHPCLTAPSAKLITRYFYLILLLNSISLDIIHKTHLHLSRTAQRKGTILGIRQADSKMTKELCIGVVKGGGLMGKLSGLYIGYNMFGCNKLIKGVSEETTVVLAQSQKIWNFDLKLWLSMQTGKEGWQGIKENIETRLHTQDINYKRRKLSCSNTHEKVALLQEEEGIIWEKVIKRGGRYYIGKATVVLQEEEGYNGYSGQGMTLEEQKEGTVLEFCPISFCSTSCFLGHSCDSFPFSVLLFLCLSSVLFSTLKIFVHLNLAQPLKLTHTSLQHHNSTLSLQLSYHSTSYSSILSILPSSLLPSASLFSKPYPCQLLVLFFDSLFLLFDSCPDVFLLTVKVRGGRKEVWEERPRPPNPGWKIVCV
ncbi:hypothetical protein VP01_713g2 [Puccinia sorghi]|uniref:Uncharacterized protein n=1 Tax=Puccinia sorghi TaxID=27349 RepID=A0A0L6UDJ5_9BASI|nr:hypothetical protein VP01_713g2 [Puccinia sorghi]